MIYYSDDNSMVVFTNKLKVNNADKKKDKKNYKRCPYKKLEQKKKYIVWNVHNISYHNNSNNCNNNCL